MRELDRLEKLALNVKADGVPIAAVSPDTLLWLIGLARPNADKVMLDRIEAQRVLRTLVGYRRCDTMTPGEIVAAESYLTAALKGTK